MYGKNCRYPDEEAGQVPMAFVVRQPQSTLSEAQVIDFVAKQAFLCHQNPTLAQPMHNISLLIWPHYPKNKKQ